MLAFSFRTKGTFHGGNLHPEISVVLGLKASSDWKGDCYTFYVCQVGMPAENGPAHLIIIFFKSSFSFSQDSHKTGFIENNKIV